MADRIKGNGDSQNGSNATYRIAGRGTNIPRQKIVRELKQGKHPNFAPYKRNGVEYVRGNPNPRKSDNVDD